MRAPIIVLVEGKVIAPFWLIFKINIGELLSALSLTTKQASLSSSISKARGSDESYLRRARTYKDARPTSQGMAANTVQERNAVICWWPNQAT